jgi:hypothetical protein
MIRVKRKTIVTIARFFVAIVICILMVLGLREIWKEKAVSQHPRKTLGFVIDLDQREKLFEQLKSFAHANNFDIHIGPTTPSDVTFSIYMSRKDVIVWGDNALNQRGYDFAFYDNDPDNPVSEEVIDSLMSELKRFISEVPKVRIFD